MKEKIELSRQAQGIDRHFPDTSRWHKPASGIFIWVELPAAIDTTQVLKIALETERIAFIPGAAFSVKADNQASNCLRLNFSHSSPAAIQEGIERLARVLNRDRIRANRSR
jgi:DNA-binding transcriptional MocR family regulator